ncbi:MAG: DUF58 domain-containing protein [Ketobacter sp.]
MRPTPRTYPLLCCWLLTGFVAALNNWVPASWNNPGWQPALVLLWQVTGILAGLLLLVDGLSLRGISGITVERRHAENLALGVWSKVDIIIHYQGTQKRPIEVFDHYPDQCDAQLAHQTGMLDANAAAIYSYRIRAIQRGDHQFGHTDVLVGSALGLWQRRIAEGETSTIKVFPNFAAVSQYTTMAMEQQSSQLGIRLQQMRGQGTEFRQLREFRQGDSLRQIDWNSSARQRKLISRDYQEERDQQVVFLVDCGRRMRSKDSELSQLDHGLNAMLLMSYAALKQGDSVGVLCFGSELRWLKPVKGIANLSKILNRVYDIDASTQASDYNEAIKQLISRHSKRALVVLLSNIRDENSEDLLASIKLLQHKHLVVLANLEEPEVQSMLDAPVENFADSLRFCGAIHYLEQRNQASGRFNRNGILTVNSSPQTMPVALVNRYYEIKREGLL